MTNKQARSFFLWTLIAFVVMLCVIGWSMAEAFNLSPYTFKLLDKQNRPDSVWIEDGGFWMTEIDSSIANILVATAVKVDTVRGSSSILGILDAMVRIAPDSTAEDTIVTITFGGYGGGIRWYSGSDEMQFTNDFVTWTAFGSGSGTGDIEGVTAGNGLSGGGTSGTVTVDAKPGWGIKIDNDSIEANATQLLDSLVDRDSTFVAHKSSRWMPLPDSSGQYMGATTDSTMLWYNLTDDNIISYVKVFYNEDVTDSALVTWGSMMAQIAATGSGDITGVITSDWLRGGASSGDVSLSIDPNILAALYLTTDTTVLEGVAVKARTSDYASSVTLVEDTIRVQNTGTGKIILNVDGTPTNTDEMTITENNIEIRSAGSNGVAVLSGFDLERVSFGALGTMFVGAGTSTPPTFTTIHSILDTLFAIEDAIGDSIAAHWATWVAPDAGDIESVVAGAGMTGGATSGAATVNVIGGWSIGVATDSIYVKQVSGDSITAGTVADARIATTITRDAELEDSLDAYLIATAIVALVEDSLDMYYDSTKAVTRIREIIEDSLDNYYDSSKVIVRIKELVRDSLFANSNNFFKTAGNGLTSSTSTVNVVAGANGLTVNADSIYIDTTKVLRTKNLIANWVTPWPDSVLGLGSGAGLTISSSVLLGTDITDDTVLVTLPAEWAGAVLSRGYGTDSTKAWDSLTISGGSDIYGNFIQFAKTATTSGTPTMMRRNFQIAIPVPDDADTIYDVSIAYRVQNGQEAESSYVRLKWSTTPFDSSSENTYKTAYTDLDSSNSTTFDTLGVDYNRTYVTRGSKIYVLVTALLYDFHATWARCYDVMMTYHRNRL